MLCWHFNTQNTGHTVCLHAQHIQNTSIPNKYSEQSGYMEVELNI